MLGLMICQPIAQKAVLRSLMKKGTFRSVDRTNHQAISFERLPQQVDVLDRRIRILQRSPSNAPIGTMRVGGVILLSSHAANYVFSAKRSAG
jgi:hypothetical protein